MVKQFGDLNAVLDAQIDDLEMVDGIGEIRAKRITESLKKLHDRAIFENGL
jgi:diadenylate cyclase